MGGSESVVPCLGVEALVALDKLGHGCERAHDGIFKTIRGTAQGDGDDGDNDAKVPDLLLVSDRRREVLGITVNAVHFEGGEGRTATGKAVEKFGGENLVGEEDKEPQLDLARGRGLLICG